MILNETILKSADNSGALRVKCIKIFRSIKNRAKIGDILTVSVKSANNQLKSKVKTKELKKSVIIRTKKFFRKTNGIKVKFRDNSVVLVDPQYNFIGTRVVGVLPKELKNKFLKLTAVVSSPFV